MLASQFNLDHRLAELRQAGEDVRVAQARNAATRSDGGAARGHIGWLRSLFGGSGGGSRSVDLATR
jgi:hypothetical protein